MSRIIRPFGQRNRSVSALLFCLVALAAPAAFAALERVGPNMPNFGYPAWYQDKSGLTFEFCSPLNQTELNGGWCLLLPADLPLGAPETFGPGTFSEEHFYWAANTTIDFPVPASVNGGKAGHAVLVLGIEGAFGGGVVQQGDQITFGRIRVDIRGLPYSGTYTILHPYGTLTFPNQVAGGRLFYTDDVGITCPQGQFDCALLTGIGPFLMPSLSPGGLEMAPIAGPVPGKLYIADPARIGPVTGAVAPNQNMFRIIGPPGSGFDVSTTNFSLVGRLFAGTIPGRVDVDRATYTRTAASTKVDVFANAFPTMVPRIPPNLAAAATAPVLSFFGAPCGRDATTGALIAPAGLIDTAMSGAGHDYWGQVQFPGAVLPPTNVCLVDETSRNATGQIVPAYFEAPVTDEVNVTSANFDPAARSLTVAATSGDQMISPPPTLRLGTTALVGGTAVLINLAAPPSKVRVVSSQGGMGELPVKAGVGSVVSTTFPVAVADAVTVLEDSTLNAINVLFNDTLGGSSISPTIASVAIVVPPRLGSATVDLGTRNIIYTPNPNANGSEGLAYTVTVNGVASTAAYVTITITPVNDPPIAVADVTATTLNTATAINVLANDTDPDGHADLVSIVIDQLPAIGATVTAGPGGIANFTATAAGTYTFWYHAVDAGGAASASVPVTVTATGEAIAVTLAEYRISQSRFRITGTDSVTGNQTLTITYDDGSASGTVIATATVAAGNWAVDIRPATGVLDPRTTGATGIRVRSSLGATATALIAVR